MDRFFVSAAVVFGAVLLAATGHADTISRTLYATYTNANGTVEGFGGVALFDPGLGVLHSVTQTLAGEIEFTATGPSASYTIGVTGPGTPITTLLTFTSGGLIQYSVTSGPTLEELTNQFGQQYVIEPFDLAVMNGVVSSVGPVTDTFTFDYTPTAVTPELPSLMLLCTGVGGGVTRLLRRRQRVEG